MSGIAAPIADAAPEAVFTDPTGGGAAAQWTAAQDGPQPYDGMSTDLSVPITMSDGKVLKADIYHPVRGGVRTTEPTPVVLQIQGYNRQAITALGALLQLPGVEQVLLPWVASLNFPGSGLEGITDFTRQLNSGALQVASQDQENLTKGGYTVVQVDIRGTGSSEGQWQVYGAQELQDANDIVGWVNEQPWSNGSIGLNGTSLTGIEAFKAATTGNPAIKAIFGFEPSADPFNDIGATGGGVGAVFLPAWLAVVNALKFAPDIESIIGGRFDPAQQLTWLRDRLADPAVLLDVVANLFTATTTGQYTPATREFLDPNSPFRQGMLIDPTKISAPTFFVSANADAFGSSALDTYNRLPMPLTHKKTIFGDGLHTGSGVIDFGEPGMPPRVDVLQRAWFDKWLKGIDNGIDRYSPITVKQVDGPWVTRTSFPTDGVTYRRAYLNATPSGTAPTAHGDGSLSADPPTTQSQHTVAPGLASICSRDTAQTTLGVTSVIVACSQDSRIRESEGLTFTGAPVTEPTVISGPIAVHLNTIHDTRDGYWTVTVNDVSPDGWSRQLSTGQLVSSLRQIDDARSSRSPNGDYSRPMPYIDLDRRQPTVPGEPTVMDIATTPIDTTLQPGHRLRVDVFAGNFPKGLPPTAMLLDSQLAPQHLVLDPAAPSWVNLPSSQPVS
ncbi:CocE/NonD family hydrolase [Nocardia brasiliensis]|uniref:Putative peptidase n=1 Tax=Nocardia brasiliensis (strain ATCC 700358 / HUJEG-1) TaxID=1133849 RepID=K0F1C5_NOCB7|nr:CocE/NonD family hydrolase [Nocardia brasiliensis]AFU02920.1 putative peptidase [Nocardia brasiliensis ATCC 700358]OCF85995.1 peptidase [Nocardia brasiliensis]